MANPTIGVVITGRSDVSAVLAATSKQMEGFRRQTEANSRQIQKMTQTSGLGLLTKGFKGVTDQSFQFYQNVTRTVDSLGVLTGASSIAGILALSKSVSGLGQSQLNASRGVNMGAQQLVAWQNVAKAAGSSADSATSSIAGMEKAVFRMTKMGDSHKGWADQALGTGWENRYKTDTDKFLAISKYVSGLHGDAKAEAMEQAEQAFGISPDFMQSVLASGPDYVQQQLKKGMASAPNAGQLGRLGDLATSFGDLENSITGAAEAGASSIAPKLIPALDTMSDWIDHHQKSFDVFASTLGAIGTGLGFKAVKGILGGKGGTPPPPDPLPPAAGPSIWARLLPLGAGAGDIAAGALTGAAIALWPETPGKDDLGMGRKSIAAQSGNAAIFASMAKAQGFDNKAIAGVLGSLSWESGLNPNASNNIGGGHYGIAQWSPERQALFKQVEGVDIHQSTFAQQADFLLREMKNNYPKTWNGLRSGNDVQTDARLFSNDYERPGNDGSIIHRTAYAQQWISLLDRASPAAAPGIGMGAEDRGSPSASMTLDERAAAVAAASGNADPGVHSGEYQSAIDGKWHPLDGSGSDLTSGLNAGDDPHVTVDVNIKHDGTVLTRQRQSSSAVTARVKTVTAMPGAGGSAGRD